MKRSAVDIAFDFLTARLMSVKDYKAPHANRPTPKRLHWPRTPHTTVSQVRLGSPGQRRAAAVFRAGLAAEIL